MSPHAISAGTAGPRLRRIVDERVSGQGHPTGGARFDGRNRTPVVFLAPGFRVSLDWTEVHIRGRFTNDRSTSAYHTGIIRAGRVALLHRRSPPSRPPSSHARTIRRRRVRPPVPTSEFAGFRFPPEVITLAVRWYLRFALSYRDVEELLAERGIDVDHVTVYRWVQRFTPLLVDAARPCRHSPGDRWFVDETYVKVAGH